MTEAPQLRGHCLRLRLDDHESFTFATRHHPVPPLDDGRLLERDLSNGVAEIFLMVEVDVGDDRNPEVECVGRVEPSSQTHLAHQELNPRSEINDGQGGEHLELGGGAHFRRHLIQSRHQSFQRRDESVFADRAAVELDSLRV